MYSDLFPTETDRALGDMAAHPRPPKPREPSVWAKAGTLLASPYTGAAQGINESLRVANRVLGALPSAPSVRERNAEIFGAIDETLRSGAEYWAPDPQTSTFASEFLHGGARVLTKVAGYNAIGGPAGALVGTSLDEAGTQYLTMRDKGVDPGTAAAAGAARGAATAVGFAIPVAGSTIGRTAALAGTGALTTVAETALTREILARANYADLAAQFDPWDPALLGASIIPGAAFGIAAHASRARRAKAAAQAQPQPDPLQAVAEEPGMVEAAHVALQRQVADANMLADAADPQARVTHQRAMDEARRALDTGEPMRLGDVVVDEGRAQAAAAKLQQAIRESKAGSYEILNDAGEAIGTISTTRQSTYVGDQLVPVTQIWNAGIDVPSEMGKGFGSRAYRSLVDEELAAGRLVWSDSEVSAQAQRLYESLARRGYTVETNPARPPQRGADGTLSTTGSYVYRVTAGPMPKVDAPAPRLADLLGRQEPALDRQPEPQAAATPAQRADRIAVERPDMPVRMDENAPSQPVRDVLTVERQLQRDVADEVDRAHQAAIECFLKFGD